MLRYIAYHCIILHYTTPDPHAPQSARFFNRHIMCAALHTDEVSNTNGIFLSFFFRPLLFYQKWVVLGFRNFACAANSQKY